MRLPGMGNLKNPLTIARAVKRLKSLPDNLKLNRETVEGAFAGQAKRSANYQIGWLNGMRPCSNVEAQAWIDVKTEELKNGA